MIRITVDPSKTLGPIRPLHGVGGGPVTRHFTYDATGDFLAAGIPFCRTHDIEYPFGAGEFVDIHCIFKDFEKDENDPASYNFTFTDEYFKAIVAAGAKPFVRLGSTIEHQPIKLYIHPPADFAKWGRICSRIVAHYNEGWANGFFMGIDYWEIWNEPDIPPCWTGTLEQMIDLYAAAASILKAEHPDIRVGGCAWADPCGEMPRRWIAAVRERGLPMDFFSWHRYTNDPRSVGEGAATVDALLREYGFSRAESIFDEWNYAIWADRLQECYDLHKRPFECAFMAAVLAELQNSPVDKAMYYDVQMCMSGSWNGVFDTQPETVHASRRKPKRLPGYYALYAWNELKKLGQQIPCRADHPDLYAVAAQGENGELRLLVSYFKDSAGYNDAPPPPEELLIELPGERSAAAYVVDETRTFEPVPLPDQRLRLSGNTCALIRFGPEA